MAKCGDGWLSRKMGGYVEDGWLSREMGAYLRRWVAKYREMGG